MPLLPRAGRFRIDQTFRERYRRPWLGIDGLADPCQRFRLLWALLSGAQRGCELDRLRLEHGHALPVNTHDEQRSLGFLLGDGPLRLEALIVLRRLLGYLHQDALGNI